MKEFKYDVFNKFAGYFRRGFKPETEPRLNPSEVELLQAIKRHPDMPLFLYGKVIRLEKSSMSYLVDLLEVKKLIEKQEDQEDRRRKSLTLTAEGEKMVEELNKQHTKFVEERLKVFTDSEKEKLDEVYATLLELESKLDEHRKKHPDFKEPDGRFRPRVAKDKFRL